VWGSLLRVGLGELGRLNCADEVFLNDAFRDGPGPQGRETAVNVVAGLGGELALRAWGDTVGLGEVIRLEPAEERHQLGARDTGQQRIVR